MTVFARYGQVSDPTCYTTSVDVTRQPRGAEREEPSKRAGRIGSPWLAVLAPGGVPRCARMVCEHRGRGVPPEFARPKP
jgi:hypothetical protein